MNLLFVCASNSVRSQIAEGWAKKMGGDKFKVRSAGMQPFRVHPMAVYTMREVDIDISRQSSSRLTDQLIQWADYIITLSETVKPYSAYFPKSKRYDHWSVPNPDTVVGPGMTKQKAYGHIRDIIRARVDKLLKSLKK
jgi:arsenate reductase